jgi:uncharacterized protein YecT (DUF1311 family)
MFFLKTQKKKRNAIMKKIISFSIIGAALVSTSAFAKDCEEGAESMGEVRQCVFNQSYMPVEANYKALIKSLGANHEAITAIKKAQDDWLTFMQSTCDYVAITYKGDGYGDDARTSCLTDFNDGRVKTLKRYINEAR